MSTGHSNAEWVILVGGLLVAVMLGLSLGNLIPVTTEQWRAFGFAVAATAALALVVFALRRSLWGDRQRAFVAFARRRGLSLDAQRHTWHEPWHTDFELFTRHKPVERWNILAGTWQGLAMEVFNCEQNDSPTDETAAPLRRTIALVQLAQDLPGIIIEPNKTNSPRREGSFITWYGAVDGEVELSDFQRRYVIMTEDDVAAGQLLHPEMETFLLKNWNIGVQIVGRRALFYADRLLRPHEIAPLLDFAAAFCQLIPQNITRDGETALDRQS